MASYRLRGNCGRKRWLTWCVSCCAALFVATAQSETPTAAPRYRAEAWLQILADPPFVVFGRASSETGSADYEGFVRTQMALITSPVVLERVLADPEIAQLPELSGAAVPLMQLRSRIMVHRPDGTELMMIAAEDADPQVAEKLANTVLDAYLWIYHEATAARTQQVIDLLDKEMERRHRELERLRGSVRALAKICGVDPWKFNAAALREGGEIDLGAIEPYENRLAAARTQILELEQRIQAQRKRLPESNVPVAMTEAIESLKLELEVQQGVAAELEVVLARRRAEFEKSSSHGLDLHFAIEELERARQVYAQVADRAEQLKVEARAPDRVLVLRRAAAVLIDAQ